jgi:hypothetical protein
MKTKEQKINYISSVIRNSEIAYDKMPTPEEFLSMCSDIICQFDTDIAIEVMKNLETRFGESAKDQGISIKVNYGY